MMKSKKWAKNAKVLTLLVAGQALASFVSTLPAQADESAVKLLQSHIDRARAAKGTGGIYRLGVKIITNDPTPVGEADPSLPSTRLYTVASYAEALLEFKDAVPPPDAFSLGAPAVFKAGADQYFNDRRYQWPVGSIFGPDYPFNPFAKDAVTVTINAETGRLTWRLDSWGGATMTTDLTAFNGALLGTMGTTTLLVTVYDWDFYIM